MMMMIRELIMITDGLWRFSWDVLYLRMFIALIAYLCAD